MVTLNSADSALKSFYLDAVAESLNMKTNPFLASIEHTSANVVGKDVKMAVRKSYSAGIGAGTETGDLPKASASQYLQFTLPLKNLYGTIEISDKALRASANDEGAFVNLLNDEMNTLVKSATFNFGRMLFGDGSGVVAKTIRVQNYWIFLDNVSGIVEGMRVRVSSKSEYDNLVVEKVDRKEKKIYISGAYPLNTDVPEGTLIYIYGSDNNELTGLGAIFSENRLYGVDRDVTVMQPYVLKEAGEIDEMTIQTALDEIEEVSGGKVNFIVCSWGVRRALISHFKANHVSLPTMELEGGFKAISYNGIPIVVDRFCPAGTMYLLNTDDFKLCQLCDWQWLEAEDGKILKQVAGKPVYTATLVKYAELVCQRPCGQGMITGITEA